MSNHRFELILHHIIIVTIIIRNIIIFFLGHNSTLTHNRIKKLLNKSVHHANKVFGGAEFYGRGMKIYKGIKFKLKGYKIDTGEECEERLKYWIIFFLLGCIIIITSNMLFKG